MGFGDPMETLLGIVVGSFAVLGALTFAFASCLFWEVLYYQLHHGPALMRDLGFREDSDSMPDDNARGYISAVAIVSVVEGGVFDRAGIRKSSNPSSASHKPSSAHRQHPARREVAFALAYSDDAFVLATKQRNSEAAISEATRHSSALSTERGRASSRPAGEEQP